MNHKKGLANPRTIDLTNKRIGLITVISFYGKKNGKNYWNCKCDCGKTVSIIAGSLIHNQPKSCGCNRYHTGELNHNYKGINELSGKFFYSIKDHAIKRNIKFNLNIKYIYNEFVRQDKKCALTGLDIVLTPNGKNQNASLDRIDSDKGYIKGNIQWVHKDINKIKSDFSQKKFVYYCCLIAKNLKNIDNLK